MGEIKYACLDLETFSSVNLSKCGVYRYAESPDFQILLFGYTLCGVRETIIAGFGEIRDTAFRTEELEAQAAQLNQEMNVAADYFDEGAWYALVDFLTVYSKDDVRFTFKNGMEIPVKTE